MTAAAVVVSAVVASAVVVSATHTRHEAQQNRETSAVPLRFVVVRLLSIPVILCLSTSIIPLQKRLI